MQQFTTIVLANRLPSGTLKQPPSPRRRGSLLCRSITFLALAIVTFPTSGESVQLAAQETRAAPSLAAQLKPFLDAISGKLDKCALELKIDATIRGKPQQVAFRLERHGSDSFDLDVRHTEYPVSLRRRQEGTALALPKHQVVFVGNGRTDPRDHLAPGEIGQRLISSGTMLSAYLPLLTSGDSGSVVLMLSTLAKLQYDPAEQCWRIGHDATAKFARVGSIAMLQVNAGDLSAELSLPSPGAPQPYSEWPDMRRVELPRDELERQLARGARRALEILTPSTELTQPATPSKDVAHGSLRWIDGQRLVVLHGTPEEIGHAHGELLRSEAQRCIDSVLYTFGTVQTVANGRWFRHDLDAAYTRLKPHMPNDHIVEARAVATTLGIDPGVLETLNVFPEMFHCSGFALFGSATVDGKLYHGRVLDYMTTIGLQDSATTFIVSVDGKIPFVNVGYAGFIGSVSGMNAQRVSLGEMGGRGEGQWDGVPMATLMRRAMEECSTLDQVKKLWSESPRTCEYYYVFADGKDRTAVGVAATPSSIQFVPPGTAHELLGEGIADAVVLSAGDRLKTLRERVSEYHGKIDVQKAQWLMSRPVAMESNLHNVLFVPEDGVLYVANASHRQPAAERPYVKFNLLELLGNSTRPSAVGAAVVSPRTEDR